MATSAGKTVGKAANSGLRLVVVGTGETRGRRPHLLRLRESLISELKGVADGQTYFLVEIALRRLIDDLKSRPAGIEVIQAAELEPSADDEALIAQRVKRRETAKAAEKKGPKAKVIERSIHDLPTRRKTTK